MININLFRDRSRYVRCYINRSVAPIGQKLAHSTSFCVLAFHNEREDRNMNTRINALVSSIN